MTERIISLMLCVLMILSTLMTLACGSAGDENTKDTTAAQDAEATDPEKIPEAPEKDFEYKAPSVVSTQFSITLSNYVVGNKQMYINSYFDTDTYYIFAPADFDISKTMLYLNIPSVYSVRFDGKDVRTGFFTFDFKKNQTVEFQFGKRGSADTTTMKLTCLQSKAATMFLEVDESLGTFQAMNEDLTKKTYAYGLCYLDSPDDTQDFVSYFDIHGHGNSTWKSPRLDKPYNLRFREDDTYQSGRKIGLLGMTPASKWNLISDTGDITKSRNRIAFYVAEQLEMDYVVELNYANLYVDGDFIGIYQVTEKPVDIEDELGLTLATDDSMNGSWIFEFDNHKGQEHQFNITGSVRVTVKSDIDGCQYDALKAHIKEVHTAVISKDGKHSKTKKTISDYLDLESFAKLLLVRDFTMDYDTVVNYWAYYDARDKKIHAGPVWDFNNSMGQTTKELYLQHDQLLVLTDTKGPGCWLVELMKFEEFTDILKDVYQKYSYVFDAEDQRSAFAVWETYYEYYKDVSNMHRARWAGKVKSGSLYGFEYDNDPLARYFAKTAQFLYKRSNYFDGLIMGL